MHEPIIETELFQRAQAVLNGRAPKHADMHDFGYRRLIKCALCGRHLIGERQKGHVYYRCQTRDCPTKCVRENVIEKAVLDALERLPRGREEIEVLETCLDELCENEDRDHSQVLAAMKGHLGQIEQILDRLTDSWLENMIDPETYEAKRRQLLLDRQSLKAKIADTEANGLRLRPLVQKYLELSKMTYLSYIAANPQKKRELLLELTSNRSVAGKNVAIELDFPFSELAKLADFTKGGPKRDTARTFDGEIRLFWRRLRERGFVNS